MLLKKEKLLLKFIITEYKIGNQIDTRDIYKKINLPLRETDLICDSLNSKGLLTKYSTHVNGGRVFTLTYQIIDYWNSHKNDALKYVIESVAIPIIIGILSAVITNIISNL